MASLVNARYVSLSSAGTRGIVYIGFLEALEDHLEATASVTFEQWRSNLKGAAGTSAGACAALAILLGIDRTTRRQMLHELSDMRTVVRHPDIALLLRHYGWEDGRAFKELVQNLLMRGGLSAHSTLGDVKRLLRQDFVCVCTDLNTGQPIMLSADNVPTMRVYDAVYASCCVPFMFTPMRVLDTVVVDGCLSCDLPEVFDEEQTLFVTLQPSPQFDARAPEAHGVDSWVDFLHGIVRCSSVAQKHRTDRIALERPDRCLRLWIPQAIQSTPSFDIHMGREGCHTLFRAGYAATLDALTNGRLLHATRTAVQTYVGLATVVTEPESMTEEPPPPTDDAPECEGGPDDE